jgi:hypothetical protein
VHDSRVANRDSRFMIHDSSASSTCSFLVLVVLVVLLVVVQVLTRFITLYEGSSSVGSEVNELGSTKVVLRVGVVLVVLERSTSSTDSTSSSSSNRSTSSTIVALVLLW